MKEEGARLLKVMTSLCQIQLNNGRHVLHEHPASALPWRNPARVTLLQHPRMNAVVSDHCDYGLLTYNGKGETMRERTPTRRATSSEQLLARLSKRCSRARSNRPLIGGRAASASLYPLPPITEILRGKRGTADHGHQRYDGQTPQVRQAMAKISSSLDTQSNILATLKEETRSMANDHRTTPFHLTDCNSETVTLDHHLRDTYGDEYTADALTKSWVRAAIHEELEYFNKSVGEEEHIDDVPKDSDATIAGWRCVIRNKKNDEDNTRVTARRVAQDVRHSIDMSVFAAPPPPRASAFFSRSGRLNRTGRVHP